MGFIKLRMAGDIKLSGDGIKTAKAFDGIKTAWKKFVMHIVIQTYIDMTTKRI